MQFRHAVCACPLETYDGNEIALQLAVVERFLHGFLRVEYDRRRLHLAMLRRNRRNLDDPAAELALHQAKAAIGLERFLDAAQHGSLAAVRSARHPRELAV